MNGMGTTAGAFTQGFRQGEQDSLSIEQKQLMAKNVIQNMTFQQNQEARAQGVYDMQKKQFDQQQAALQSMQQDYIRSTMQESMKSFWNGEQADVNAVNQALQSPVMQEFMGTKKLNMLNGRDEQDRGYAKSWLVGNGVKAADITPEMVDGVINSNVLLKTDSGDPLDMGAMTVATGTYKYMNASQRKNFEAVISGHKELMQTSADVKGDIAQNVAGLVQMGYAPDEAINIVGQIKGKLPAADIQVLSQAFKYIKDNNMDPTPDNIRNVVSSMKGKSPRAGEPATPVDKVESYQEQRARLGLKAPTGEGQIMDTAGVPQNEIETLTVKAQDAFGDFSQNAKQSITDLMTHKKDLEALPENYDPSQTGLVNRFWMNINRYMGLGDPKKISADKKVGAAFTGSVAKLRHALYGATLTGNELADANRQFGTLWESDKATAQTMVNLVGGYISKLEAIRQDNPNVFDLKYGQSLLQLRKLQSTMGDVMEGKKPLSQKPVVSTTGEITQRDIDAAKNEIWNRMGVSNGN